MVVRLVGHANDMDNLKKMEKGNISLEGLPVLSFVRQCKTFPITSQILSKALEILNKLRVFPRTDVITLCYF